MTSWRTANLAAFSAGSECPSPSRCRSCGANSERDEHRDDCAVLRRWRLMDEVRDAQENAA